MKLTVKQTDKWGQVLWLSDENIELGAALEFGLRIVHVSCKGMENLFYEQPADLSDGFVNPNGWRLYGGHRLWFAPESPDSYAPDNAPVTWSQEADGSVLLTQPVDPVLQLVKTIRIRFLGESRVELEQGIQNVSDHAVTGAVWSVNSLACGGVAEIPFAPKGENSYAPERLVSLWGETNLHDPRLHFGKTGLTATYVDIPDYLKIGMYCCQGCAVLRGHGQVFALSFPAEPKECYADNGCNFELYMNQRFIELETLGQKTCLQPGQTAYHKEIWHISPM